MRAVGGAWGGFHSLLMAHQVVGLSATRRFGHLDDGALYVQGVKKGENLLAPVSIRILLHTAGKLSRFFQVQNRLDSKFLAVCEAKTQANQTFWLVSNAKAGGVG